MVKQITGKCQKCGVVVDTDVDEIWVASLGFGLFCNQEHYQEFMREIGIFHDSSQGDVNE